MTNAINIHGLRIERGTKVILSGIDFQIAEGSFVAIVGPNGSGKTSILKTLLGLMNPYEGELTLCGQSLDKLSPRERSSYIAWLPQKDFTAEPMAVLDFVMTSRYRFRESTSDSIEAAKKALQRVAMSHMQDRFVSTLSGGECQRVSLACLLAQSAPILLVDEPGNHLDPGQQLQVYMLLGELWREGKTIVCVTHDVNLLRQVGVHDDAGQVRVVGLNEGALAFDEVLSEPALPGHLSTLFDVNFSTLSTDGGPYFGIAPKGRA
jgi:iron complex transport system ATP-binding protein